MTEDYFAQVGSQLTALCNRSAHRRSWRRAWLHVRPSTVALSFAAAAAVAVFVVALGTLSGGSHGSKSAPAARVPPAGPRTLADGLHQSGAVLGRPGAPVTIALFSDLECPVCRDFVRGGGFRWLVRGPVRSGQVDLVFRSLCTATCNGPNPKVFDAQQAAAEAAGGQNRLWQYALTFFAEQGAEDSRYVTPAFLTGVARRVAGLRISPWQRARRSRAMLDAVRSDERLAAAQGYDSTPTLVLRGPGGEQTLVGVPDAKAIARALARAR